MDGLVCSLSDLLSIVFYKPGCGHNFPNSPWNTPHTTHPPLRYTENRGLAWLRFCSCTHTRRTVLPPPGSVINHYLIASSAFRGAKAQSRRVCARCQVPGASARTVQGPTINLLYYFLFTLLLSGIIFCLNNKFCCDQSPYVCTNKWNDE